MFLYESITTAELNEVSKEGEEGEEAAEEALKMKLRTRVIHDADKKVQFLFRGQLVASASGCTEIPKPFVPAGYVNIQGTRYDLYLVPCGSDALNPLSARCSPAWMVKPIKSVSQLHRSGNPKPAALPNMKASMSQHNIFSGTLPRGADASFFVTALTPNVDAFELSPSNDEDSETEAEEEAEEAEDNGDAAKAVPQANLITPDPSKFILLTRLYFDNEEAERKVIKIKDRDP